MSLAMTKQAQYAAADDELLVEELLEPSEDEKPILIEVADEPKKDSETIVFSLPMVPGASDQADIEVGPQSEIEVSAPEDKIEVEDVDEWDWYKKNGLKGFLTWLKGMMDNVPSHSGKDVSGLERTIAYFEGLEKEISKAMRMDFRGEIDAAKAEEARAEIENGLERLIERLEKVKSSKFKRHQKKIKKGDVEFGIVKEGQKAPHVGGIIVTVPLLISRIARVCINGAVSGGHSIEDVFADQVKKYKLNDREQAEAIQLIEDCGYPIMRDRGWKIDENGKRCDTDNYDWGPANYPG